MVFEEFDPSLAVFDALGRMFAATFCCTSSAMVWVSTCIHVSSAYRCLSCFVAIIGSIVVVYDQGRMIWGDGSKVDCKCKLGSKNSEISKYSWLVGATLLPSVH
jgi:hypothetical protein